MIFLESLITLTFEQLLASNLKKKKLYNTDLQNSTNESHSRVQESASLSFPVIEFIEESM